MLSHEQARQIVIDQVVANRRKLVTETVAIADALGRVLATEIRSDRAYPPFDRSTRDGFAVRAAEAVANAQKHSGASAVDVSIVDRGDTLTVEVTDNGVGGAYARGSGLQGLRDRVETVGGSFRVRSPRGSGTVVTATIPVSAAKPGPARPRPMPAPTTDPAPADGPSAPG